MGCSSCGGGGAKKVERITSHVIVNENETTLIVGKSEDSNELVKLRYYGGGMGSKPTSGCKSCSGNAKYSMITTEVIQFASDDSPTGWFKQTFTLGRDYFVSRAQADYLLKMTFRNRAGQTAHKFKEIE